MSPATKHVVPSHHICIYQTLFSAGGPVERCEGMYQADLKELPELLHAMTFVLACHFVWP